MTTRIWETREALAYVFSTENARRINELSQEPCRDDKTHVPRSPRRAQTILLLALCLTASALAQSPELFEPDGYVNDFANVLDESAETYLEDYLGTLERDTTVEVAVATVPTLGGTTIEDYATRLFAAWKIGQAARDNGVLLLVAPTDRAVRIEVGYGLEGALPDGLAGDIIRNDILPEFRAGNIPRGIGRGLDRIARITRGEAATYAQPSAAAEDDTPSPWVMVPFFGLFVALGAFGLGVGVRTKTIGPLLWGGMFGGVPLVMSFAFSPTIALSILAPLGVGIVGLGYVKGGSPYWKQVARTGSADGRDTSDPEGWTMGGSGGSSSSDHSSSSSSSDFGGGSSGGGGATGRW